MGKGKINLKNIVGIRFKKLGKIYFFNPKGIKVQKGDKVIVETSQGEEYAEVLIPNRNVEDEKILAPLKKLLITLPNSIDVYSPVIKSLSKSITLALTSIPKCFI